MGDDIVTVKREDVEIVLTVNLIVPSVMNRLSETNNKLNTRLSYASEADEWRVHDGATYRYNGPDLKSAIECLLEVSVENARSVSGVSEAIENARKALAEEIERLQEEE